MKNLLLILLVGVLISLGLLAPLAIIWALNTLFPALNIAYSFWTWLAVVVLNLTWLSKSHVQKVKLSEK